MKRECRYTLEKRREMVFFLKLWNMDLKELYRQHYDFNANHSELLRLSQNLTSLSPLLFRGLMTSCTIKDRHLEPSYLWPLKPENLLCAERFAASLKWVLRLVYLTRVLHQPPFPPRLWEYAPPPSFRGAPDWSKGSPAPSVSQWFRMSTWRAGASGRVPHP